MIINYLNMLKYI